MTDSLKQFYSINLDKFPFSDNDFNYLLYFFLKEYKILSIDNFLSQTRPRLAIQLSEMCKSAYLQPYNHIKRLLRYPIFYLYVECILGRSFNGFIHTLNLPEIEYPSLNEQRLWKESTCWLYLETTICTFFRCSDDKNKEYIEYQIICEIETENEDCCGTENVWAIYKRYSDFRVLQLQLKKLHPDLGKIEFPSRTILPGRAVSLPIIEQRIEQLHIFLNDVISWIKNQIITARESKDDSNKVELIEIMKLLDGFLEVSQLDRKPPNKNDKDLSCNMFHTGWFSHLCNSKELSQLYCGYSTINCEVLATLLKKNTNIHTLDITFATGGSLRNDGFRSLIQLLSDNKTGIKHLYMGGFQGHNCDNEDITQFFEQNKTLESFYAPGGVSMSIDEPLLAFASRIPSLVILDLSKCFSKQPKAAQAIVNLIPNLKNHKTLQELYLNDNHIGNRGAELIGEALIENTSLRILSLRTCSIGPAGVIALCQVLADNDTLEKLFLTDRPSSLAIGAPSSLTVTEEIATMISHNTKLVELDLSRQYLGDHCSHIIKALGKNTTLKTLSLRNNRCSASSILEIFLTENQSITSFDLAHNDLFGEDSNSVSESLGNINNWISLLAQDQFLNHLSLPYLDSSQFSSSLIEALSMNGTLTSIEFCNPIECIKELDIFFNSNISIKEIINLESPKKGLFSIHNSIISSKYLERLHWNNITCIELKKLIQHLQERDSLLNFSFLPKDGEIISNDILGVLNDIYKKQ